MIRLAAQHHIAVFLDPIETGGWLNVLRRNGTAKAYAYGRYLGQRYRRFAEHRLAERQRLPDLEQAQRRRAGVGRRPGHQSPPIPAALQTVELNYEISTSSDDPRWRGIIGIDAAYTYAPTYAEVLKAYGRPDHLPVVMIEASYEGEHDYTGPSTLRRQEYWTMLSGATGQFYGNKYTWQFLAGWPRLPRHDRVTAADVRH